MQGNIVEQFTKWLIRNPFKKTRTIHRNISIGRNDPCYCGSNIKFKYCCLLKIKPPLTQLAKKERQKEFKYYEKRYKRETGKNLIKGD